MNSSPPICFTQLENFGHSLSSPSYLIKPKSVDELNRIFQKAKGEGMTMTLRGAGRSYNDASMNGGGIVVDLRELNRIQEWDPTNGLVQLEPGVTIQELWQKVLPDGWWPPVVSGTMTTTLGGCLASNIHGKNNHKMGTIGEHVVRFTALLPNGTEIICSPKKNGDLFRAMIGGLGLLGVFTSITLQMKKVHSGLLDIRAWNVPDIDAHLIDIGNSADDHAYTVGWMDLTAGGKSLGRGQIHTADYLEEDGDPSHTQKILIEDQTLPNTFFGIIPKSLLHYFMAPFMNNFCVGIINTARYFSGRKTRNYRQSHAAFHFLLDYIPDWERAYGHLIQYQSFLPKETARIAWTEMIRISNKRGLPSFLGVTKRHRPDTFLLTHGVDGFSLAMDFKVIPSERERQKTMLQDFDQIILAAGGRFYFAKNSETNADTTRQFLGDEAITKFRNIKKRCDPDNILESDLFRRIFGNE